MAHVQKYQTRKIEKTLNPEWDECFFFDVWSPKPTLWLDVYDADLTSDDYLGQAVIDLGQLLAAGTSWDQELSLPLTPCSDSRALPERVKEVVRGICGDIMVELHFDEERSRLQLRDSAGLRDRLEKAMETHSER